MVFLKTNSVFQRRSLRKSAENAHSPRQIRQVNLLMSDTGGGHRSCATALREAFLEVAPDVRVDIIDGFTESRTFPLYHMPGLYTRLSTKRHLWRTGFHLTNGRRWSSVVFYPLQKRSESSLLKVITRNDPDLVVVLHPCLTNVTYKALNKLPDRPKMATVITDLITGHASWFSHGADVYYVPTQAMYEKAVRNQIPEEKVLITGLPLAKRLFALRSRKEELRRELGFEGPTVVCVGGADGMGIQGLTPSLARLPHNIKVHIICGKNQPLLAKLRSQNLPDNIRLHGFVTNLPEMLAAADLALTKASPTVLMETIAVGTYALLYNFMPGQEYPNIGFVKENRLGDYSKSPRGIARKIRRYFQHYDRSKPAQAISYVPPDGARIIARHLLGLDETPQPLELKLK